MRVIVFLKMFKIEPKFRKCKKKKKKKKCKKKRKKIFFVAEISTSENVAISCLC